MTVAGKIRWSLKKSKIRRISFHFLLLKIIMYSFEWYKIKCIIFSINCVDKIIIISFIGFIWLKLTFIFCELCLSWNFSWYMLERFNSWIGCYWNEDRIWWNSKRFRIRNDNWISILFFLRMILYPRTKVLIDSK